ncbi:hypothetical protein A2U01_0085875, partial [Trifolium medium]|nr:hypothetical protein [Trifolium medium]
MAKRDLIVRGTTTEFKVGPENILRCNGRVCVPDAKNLRNVILEEAHKSKLSIHPGATEILAHAVDRCYRQCYRNCYS